MKKLLMAAALLASAGAGIVASAQDVVKVDPHSYKVEFENDQVRIIRVKRAPHSKVPMHSHPDNVIMMVTNTDQKITTPDGKTSEAHLKAGEVVYRGAVTHAEESISDKPIEVVLVELKPAALAAAGAGIVASAQDVVKVAPGNYMVEFENDQIRIIRTKRSPHSKVPMHSHPDYVVMMITNNDNKITTPDGKTTETHRKAGEVFFSKSLMHAEENISDQPLELVLVELKTPGMK